jgi:gliding motility-associated-like protein
VLNYKLNIYNRFGQLIFQTSDPTRGWDGTLSGLRQPEDVYVWICEYQLSGTKPDEKSGTVVLIR